MKILVRGEVENDHIRQPRLPHSPLDSTRPCLCLHPRCASIIAILLHLHRVLQSRTPARRYMRRNRDG